MEGGSLGGGVFFPIEGGRCGDEVLLLTEQQFKQKIQDMSLAKMADLSLEYSLRANKYRILARWADETWCDKSMDKAISDRYTHIKFSVLWSLYTRDCECGTIYCNMSQYDKLMTVVGMCPCVIYSKHKFLHCNNPRESHACYKVSKVFIPNVEMFIEAFGINLDPQAGGT